MATFDVICEDLCFEDEKYLNIDSHIIHLPKTLFIDFMKKINETNSCIELSNPLFNDKKIFIRKFVSSFGRYSKMAIIPKWICDKLELNIIGSQINISFVNQVNIIKKMKIKGNKSSYVNIDIKKLLEEKIENLKCINVNTFFHINDIIFTICDLTSINDEKIQYGITTDEIEIDFETPDDIQKLERRKIIFDKIIDNLNLKISFNNNDDNKKKIKKTGIFKFSDLINNNDSNVINKYTLDDLYNELFETFDNENDKLLLKEIFDEIYDEYKTLSNKQNTNNKINSVFDGKGYKLSNNDLSNNDITNDKIRQLRLEKLISNV